MAALSTENGAESTQLAVERLRTLDGEGLRLEWRNLFGKRAHKALPKSLLIRALAYRLQALELGDLDPQTLRVLDAYGAKSRGRLNGRVRLDQLRGRSAASYGLAVKPGSILVREWSGELHRVTALESGFVWNGGTYRSLSEVARAITGTRWNGPRFFGLGRESEAARRATGLAKRGRGSVGRDRDAAPDPPPAYRGEPPIESRAVETPL
jgi:hypothetical protein